MISAIYYINNILKGDNEEKVYIKGWLFPGLNYTRSIGD